MLDRIAAEAQARNIRRLFLESGAHNSRAHNLFERSGFQVCSVVMMRSLDRSSDGQKQGTPGSRVRRRKAASASVAIHSCTPIAVEGRLECVRKSAKRLSDKDAR